MTILFIISLLMVPLWAYYSTRIAIAEAMYDLFTHYINDKDILSLMVLFEDEHYLSFKKYITYRQILSTLHILNSNCAVFYKKGKRTAKFISKLVAVNSKSQMTAIDLVSNMAVYHNDSSFVIFFLKFNKDVNPKHFVKICNKLRGRARNQLIRWLRADKRSANLINMM